MINGIGNFVFGLAEIPVYDFCKSRKQKFVIPFAINTEF